MSEKGMTADHWKKSDEKIILVVQTGQQLSNAIRAAVVDENARMITLAKMFIPDNEFYAKLIANAKAEQREADARIAEECHWSGVPTDRIFDQATSLRGVIAQAIREVKHETL